ncbi:MAG: sigma-70 family RNA polymerase sigma factor [Clostridiales bacterium]|nr:sigma-70 family RNA polymerase sigma factor [Clostridiales bacterium]
MPPMLDDRQLVARAQGGDPEAFSQLVERHQTMVYRLALGKTGSPQDAEEVTQTAFLKAWQGLRTFQGKAAFSTWLYRLTANAAVDLLRRRREPALSLDDPDLPPIPDQAPSPEELSMAAERRRLLWQAIDQLPESHRLPLVLRELEGLSYREIARALDLEEGTVKSRLARGRLMLRQQLLESGTFYPTQAAEAPAGKGGRRK